MKHLIALSREMRARKNARKLNSLAQIVSQADENRVTTVPNLVRKALGAKKNSRFRIKWTIVGSTALVRLAQPSSKPNLLDAIGEVYSELQKEVALRQAVPEPDEDIACGMVAANRLASRIMKKKRALPENASEEAKWFDAFLNTPHPALNDNAPAWLMKSPEGTELVLKLMAAIEAGANL